MNLTLMYFDGCPSWQTALERVKAAAVLARVRVHVDLVAVTSDEDAVRLDFTGSPTILLDGTDPFATPSAGPALACRLYATPDGLAGSPSLDQLVDVLTRADRLRGAADVRRAARWLPAPSRSVPATRIAATRAASTT